MVDGIARAVGVRDRRNVLHAHSMVITKIFHGMLFSYACGAVRCGFTEPHCTVRFCLKQTAPNRTASHRRIIKTKKFAPNRTVDLWSLNQVTCSGAGAGAGAVRCGFHRFFPTPHRTVRKSQNKIRTAPHRRMLQIEKTHRGSVLHPCEAL